MKFGMDLLLWTDHMHDGMTPVLRELKEIGYDAVEVPIFQPDVESLARLGQAASMTWASNAPGSRFALRREIPFRPIRKTRAAGIDEIRRTLDCCQALGAPVLCGPIHSALGHFSGRGPTPDEWKWGVDSMRQMAEHAKTTGVTLAVEYLNRFETYFLNCAADTVRFVKEVNHPNCRMMYDTFHSNIEEKNTRDAIRTAMPYTVLVHISENDRSTPGQGNVRWQETFDGLREANYDGWMVVEAFGLALPEILPATKIWRRMYDSEEQLARDALTFMKAETAAQLFNSASVRHIIQDYLLWLL